MSDGAPVANAGQAQRSDKYSALEASALTLEDKSKGAEILKNLAASTCVYILRRRR
jgi:hypothetical protein